MMILLKKSDVVATKNMSKGNASVGEMWVETKVFKSDTPVGEIMEWCGNYKNVILSVSQP